MTQEPSKMSRALGIILGAAVGDSLGAPLEFLTPRTPANFVRDMIGGGTLRWKPGEPTDDTVMAMAIMDMYEEHGEYNQKSILNKWIDWRNSRPKDIGNWTNKVLSKWNQAPLGDKELRSVENPAVQTWQAHGSRDAGNGSVMRCMPSVVFHHEDYETMLRDTMNLSEDTHPDPKCIMGCCLVNQLLFDMLHDRTRAEAYKTALITFPANLEIMKAFAEAPTLPWNQWNNGGYVVDTVRCAVAALLQSSSFEEGLVAVVNRGNDADSVGAVAGALLGAHFGVGAIPIRWLNTLKAKDRLVSFVKRSILRSGKTVETI